MSKIVNNLLLASLTLAPGLSFAFKTCATHEACAIGHLCQCVVPATSAYDRYFYFDVAKFHPKEVYHCTLKSKPSIFTFDLLGSTFPEKSLIGCEGGNCPRFPLTVSIDTREMIKPVGQAIIKYCVPGSDMPSNVSIDCEQRLLTIR